ncbi:MAG TPA: DegQ family serine endoprotease [Steroidobacteraceae bacterium]|jgi:serine protease Do/serine protease DegQ|nr:DegQ family serine endoprotease [Steroidobacteraceae bacterium]
MNLRLELAAVTLALAALIAPSAAIDGAALAASPSAAQDAAPMPSLAPMVKRVSPAVVNIATRGTIKEKEGQRNPLLDDPFFRRFFDVPPDARPRERQFQSAGSGVIVDAKNGYIITNHHVVENASEITITLLDNRSFSAKVVGTDEGADIAVLQAKQPNLVAMSLGDSAKLEVGDYVVAIGNPFGLQHTVTAGIVSALGRTGINPDGYEDFIQTDASINPGNSGGALVNLRGELVGVNSAILSGSGGNIGIGFAIPVNLVKNVMDQLIKYGQVKRGVLGVNLYPVTADIAKEFGVSESSGALVAGVQPGSAAEKAGVKTGDIITSLNGVAKKDPGELRYAIGLLHVGDKVDIGLLRDGKPRTVTAVIAERPETETANAVDINRGLEGADLTDSPDGNGVLVKSLQDGSPAAQAGLRSNDLIVGVGRTPVTNTKAFKEAAKGASVLVLNVRRGGTVLLIPIR